MFYLPVVGRNWTWRWYTRALERYGEAFARSDVVLATWLYPDAVAAAAWSERHGKPLWIKMHGTDRFHLDAPGRRTLVQKACRQAAGVIVNAGHVGDYLAARGVDREKIHVVRNGVNADFASASAAVEDVRPHGLMADESEPKAAKGAKGRLPPLKTSGGWTKGQTTHSSVVLFVGNLVPIKGPDVALSAFAQSVKSAIDNRQSEIHGPAPTLVILGTGPMLGALKATAARLGIADRVRFLGSRPHAEVAGWMRRADCLLLTSRSEGSPNVVAEALTCGLPVVATAVGDVSERVEDGRNGYAVDLNPAGTRVERLAEAVRTALAASWDRKSIAAANPPRTWDDAANELLRLFVGEGRPRKGTEDTRGRQRARTLLFLWLLCFFVAGIPPEVWGGHEKAQETQEGKGECHGAGRDSGTVQHGPRDELCYPQVFAAWTHREDIRERFGPQAQEAWVDC